MQQLVRCVHEEEEEFHREDFRVMMRKTFFSFSLSLSVFSSFKWEKRRDKSPFPSSSSRFSFSLSWSIMDRPVFLLWSVPISILKSILRRNFSLFRCLFNVNCHCLEISLIFFVRVFWWLISFRTINDLRLALCKSHLWSSWSDNQNGSRVAFQRKRREILLCYQQIPPVTFLSSSND